MRTLCVFCTCVLVAFTGCQSSRSRDHADHGELQLPGIQPDGAIRLPTQWFLRPAGKQVLVGDFPVNIALHPGGRFAAVLHCGNGVHEVVVLELPGGRLVSRVGVDEAFYGLAFAPDGSRLFCSGAGKEIVHGFEFKSGYLGAHEELRVHESKERGIPAGIACSADGQTLYVASVWGQSVSFIDVQAKTVSSLPLGTNGPASPPKELPPPVDEDEAAITKRAEAL